MALAYICPSGETSMRKPTPREMTALNSFITRGTKEMKRRLFFWTSTRRRDTTRGFLCCCTARDLCFALMGEIPPLFENKMRAVVLLSRDEIKPPETRLLLDKQAIWW